jgi:hypothetical protein
MHEMKSIRVPLSALWPPMALIGADLLLLNFAVYFGYLIPTLFLAGGIGVLLFDIRGRMHDFRNAYVHILRGREPARVAKTFQFSWCGRVACQSAAYAVDDNCGLNVARYYENNGYRWFHVFPDNTFTLKCPFLTLRFWDITLRGNSRARQRLEEDGSNHDPVQNAGQDAQDTQSTDAVRQAA